MSKRKPTHVKVPRTAKREAAYASRHKPKAG